MKKYTTPEMSVGRKALRTSILAGSGEGRRSVGKTTGLDGQLSGAGQNGKITSGNPFFDAL